MSVEGTRADSKPRPSALNKLPDEELIEQVKQGDRDALTYLFKRYHRLVLNVAAKIVRDSAEAEDLTQEVFLEIYRKADKFDPAKGSVRTWILQYAYHRSLDRRKYLRLRKIGGKQSSQTTVLKTHCFPNGNCGLASEELASFVRQGLATLSEKQRQTLELAHFQGLPLTEIADRMKESLGNVRNHYYRGINKLRAFLRDHSCLSRNGTRSPHEPAIGGSNDEP